MNMSRASRFFLIPLTIIMGLGAAHAEDSRFMTEYDETLINEGSSRVKIWDQSAVNEGEPKSYGTLTPGQGGVGITVDGQSLDSTWERFNSSEEVQNLRTDTTTISSNLEDLNDLVTMLEEGGLWELMEPVVGNWNVTTDTGGWNPNLLVANDEYQFRDGEKTQERLVETYERNRETGETRLVDSYTQNETEYFFDARLVEVAASKDGADPGDASGWSDWKVVSGAQNCREWLPLRKDWPRNTLIPQTRVCDKEEIRTKSAWEVNEDTGELTLIDHLTNYSDGTVLGSSGKDYSSMAYGCISICFSNPYEKDTEFLQERASQRGTGPNLPNGCYYSTSEVDHHETYTYSSGWFGDGSYTTQQMGGPRFMAKTYQSTNQNVPYNIVTELYVNGWPLYKTVKSCMWGGCTYDIVAGDWVDTPYNAYESPFTAARRYESGLNVSEMPIYVPAIRKKISIGSTVSQTVITKEDWYGGTWKEYDRTHKVCVSDY